MSIVNKTKPFLHQELAINNVLNGEQGLNKKDRTQLIMSCGTGKSLTAMWTHEKFVSSLDESITLLFYPSLFLVNQTYNTYKENSILKFNPLSVCSDTAIGNNENDDIFELDINEVKYPVTTNIEDIKIYLQDKSIKHKIVFITYQSCELIGAALNELDMKADLGIFDEAHKTATANIESKFAFALKDENIQIAKRLFMTATPRHIKFNVDSEDEEVEVFSMNNPELYGNIAYEYPMREAINDGIITDYKIVGILIDDKYIDSYTNKVKPYSEDVINEAKIKAINEAMNKYGLNKALIFNRDIAASKELEKYSNTSIFNKIIKHLDGSSKHSYREQILKELKDNERYVITNAKLFTEGVDLPIIDMIALFRNVKSEIDIIQTVGRVQRIDKNNPNKIGYILLPIFVSNIDLIDEEIKTNKDLGYVFEVINSLKENDEQLRATLENKKQNKSKRNNSDELKNKNPNFGIEYIASDSSHSNEHTKEISEKITHRIETIILTTKVVRKSKEKWKVLFKEYDNEFGLSNLSKRTTYKNEKIGSKLNELIKIYKSLNNELQQHMREFWDCIPLEIWQKKELFKTPEEWKELFKEYQQEIDFEDFSTVTIYKNENLGSKYASIKNLYHKLSSEEKIEFKKTWDCIPSHFFDNKVKTKSKEEWKELFTQFIKEFGFEKLNRNTIFKDVKLSGKYERLKVIYNSSSEEVKKQMRAFWDCFPEITWNKRFKTQDDWKALFIEYDKEIGLVNLRRKTIYRNENLGQKLKDLKTLYKKSTPEKQKEMKEFWDCFPQSVWCIYDEELTKNSNNVDL